ncbi:MAG: tripartite tricarboxylate transporter substrate binding protein [Betaproteobacteria bacterium]|nr:tripartite tricarboxylate transporter substrate binding protein [Betaproteobacteria bacterium]
MKIGRAAKWCWLFCFLTAAGAAVAQPYPTKPIRFVHPYAPGGVLDTIGRITAQKLSEQVSQPVVVENRTGASGIIGGDLVAKAAPDGYTLLVTVPSLFTIVPHMQEMPFRIEQLGPVSVLSTSPMLLVTNLAVPAKTVSELIALAKSKPRSLSAANAGNGTLPHLVSELFQAQAGVEFVQVPFKGSGPALVDLTGGHVQLMFDNIPSALPHVKAGRLRALAITSRQRFAVAPDVPTMRESGMGDFEVSNWIGIFAPAATPKEIILKLHRELVRVVKSPEVGKRFLDAGASPVGNSPEEVAAMVRTESEQWGKLIRKLGLKGG